MRRSECITPVMVLPAAIGCDGNAATSASTDNAIPETIVGRFEREMGTFDLS